MILVWTWWCCRFVNSSRPPLHLFRTTTTAHFVGNFDRSVPGDGVQLSLSSFLRTLDGLLVMVCVLLLRSYRVLLGPLFGGSCRFVPSCSHYAEQSIRQHGSIYGLWLTLGRLSRCHPFHAGGYDPVPERVARSDYQTVHKTLFRNR